MTAAPTIVRIGRRVPLPGILFCLGLAAALMLATAIVMVAAGRPEQLPIVLAFLLIPAIGVPPLVLLNTFAEYDQATGLISINGRPGIPLAAITYGGVSTAQGVASLTLGTGPARRDRFTVSSRTLLSSPRRERDWVRSILPSTGLQRDPEQPMPNLWGRSSTNSVSLEVAQHFAETVLT